ncbi:glutamate receptor 2-like [Haliotis cracherodii]|uniref:glutamate receptor 2-like n=1 Tax=Haliotis cracherodii TaxID=6455 RepID=UPI0039EA3B14
MEFKRILEDLIRVVLLVCVLCVSSSDGRCKKTENKRKLPLTIGVLEGETSGYTVKNMEFSGDVKQCFHDPHFVVLHVQSDLRIITDGWTEIEEGMKRALSKQAGESKTFNLIIGPFYTNLAMMLEKNHIPYLVTDYKGFKDIDMSRVQDRTNWRTLVEIRPPAQEQNMAVVDLFQKEKWESAVMLMPKNEADNQECQDLAQQMVGRGISVIPYSIDPEEARKMIKQAMRNFQLLNQKQVVMCSPRDAKDRLIQQLLKVAKLYNLLMDVDLNFIFVDSSSNLEPLAGADQMYRLRLFSARCKLYAFRYFHPPQEGESGDANVAIAKDAASVTKDALAEYLYKITEPTNIIKRKILLKALKGVRLHGDTGLIRFNGTGQRVNYTLYLYNHGGEDMYRKVGEWIPSGSSANDRLNMTQVDDDDDEDSDQSGIFPDTVNVVVVEEEPFVMKKLPNSSMNNEGNDRYEGFTIDLLRKLKEELKFKYKIYVSPKNAYGVKNMDDGKWDGMVGEIISKNATLAMGAISITSQRETDIDFSQGIISTGINILIYKPQEEYNIFQFLFPFSLYLWLAIIGASIFVSFVLFLLDYTNPNRKFTPKETLWYAVGTLLKRGTDFSPKPVSQRILSAGFTFFVLITVSSYTANMAAFLTTKSLEKTINSFDDLSESEQAICTVDKSATMKFFEKGHSPVYKRIWDTIVAVDGLVPNASSGRDRVMNKECAFIFDFLINEYSEYKKCCTKAVAVPILMQEHGIGMAQGAPFKTKLNIALLKLKESGQINQLKKKWWDDKRQCNVASDRANRAQFGLTHTAGVFILALFGLVFSVAFFLFKKFYLRRKLKKQAQKAEKEKELLCKGSPSSV